MIIWQFEMFWAKLHCSAGSGRNIRPNSVPWQVAEGLLRPV